MLITTLLFKYVALGSGASVAPHQTTFVTSRPSKKYDMQQKTSKVDLSIYRLVISDNPITTARPIIL